MLLYGVGRFLVEFLRNDNRGGAWMFSTSQWISMVIVAGGIVLYLVNKKGIIVRKRKMGPGSSGGRMPCADRSGAKT